MLPTRNEVMAALIELLEAKESATPQQAYEELADYFALDKTDLDQKTNDGKEPLFHKDIRWARKTLVDKGRIKQAKDSGKGTWTLCKPPRKPILCDSVEELDAEVKKLGRVTKKPRGQRSPKTKSTKSVVYRRDAEVVAYVLSQASGKCECCGNKSPFLKAKDGEPYLEVHHLRQLANGGSDTVENAIAACPNCHRELHHGQNCESLKKRIYSTISRLVPE